MAGDKTIISRTKQSAKNTIISLSNFVVNTIMAFITKTVFIYVLGAELLGLNSLFANILTMLSLAELGIGSAIVFSLYKPMAEQNNAKINALIKLYKKIYFIIGGIVLLIGLILLPFIKFFINADNTLNINIYILYFMYLINSVVGYFFAHRRAIIFTSQRNDIESLILIFVNLFSKISEIVVIICFKNYYIYYSIIMLSTLLEGTVIYFVSSKIYKNLDLKNADEISKKEKQSIFKDVKGMLCHKVGVAVVNGTDNIIISAFINLTVLGAYSNYILISSSISSALYLIINALKASFGNAVATKSTEEVEKVQHRILFGFSWLIIFCATSLLCLLQSFISIWLSNEYAISILTVVMIVLSFTIDKSRNVIDLTRDCAGLFRYKKWCPICEAITNLIASLILVDFMGLPGVILGTIIGYVLFPLWVEPWVVYKYYYHKSSKGYWKRWLTYFFVGALIAAFTYFVCSLLPNYGIWWFILKCGICLFAPNVIMLLVFCRTQEFKYYFNLLKSFFKKKKRSEG